MSVQFLINSIDPTRTITLRNKFVQNVRGRFSRLMGDIREAVIDLDVFNLSQGTQRGVFNASGLQSGQFDFPRSDRKVEEFVKWLSVKNNEYFLSDGTSGIRTIGQVSTDPGTARSSWMNTYLDSAYQTGIRRGREELKKIGVLQPDGALGAGPIQVAFNNPIHTDRVGLIYTRAYSSLKAITTEMESAVSDVLALSLAEGRNPRQIARILDKTITGRGESLAIVDSLGRRIPSRRRAEVLARTEVIRAHHAANMGEYRSAGALGITVLAEHLTAGDHRVCPKCAPLNGKRYSLEEAEYMIPVHPQCRCVAIPYIQEEGGAGTPPRQEPPAPQFPEQQASVLRIRNELLAHGDNLEHAVLTDETGRVIASEIGVEEGVAIPFHSDLRNPNANLFAHHNHPIETPPSEMDVLQLIELPGIKKSYIHTPEKTYSMQVISDVDRGQLFNDARSVFGESFQKATKESHTARKAGDFDNMSMDEERSWFFTRISILALDKLKKMGVLDYEILLDS